MHRTQVQYASTVSADRYTQMTGNFGELLNELCDEFTRCEAEQAALANDPIEHLKADAVKTLSSESGETVTWHSSGSYEQGKSVKMTEPQKLDLRF